MLEKILAATLSGFHEIPVIGFRPPGYASLINSRRFLRSQTTVYPLLLVLARICGTCLFQATTVTSSSLCDRGPGEYGLLGLFKSQIKI
jgi:hypothetical protein